MNARPISRKKSFGLDADQIRGDTGAPAMSTLNSQDASYESNTPSLSPLVPSSPKSLNKPLVRPRRKARSLLRKWKDLSFRHTWVNPLIMILFILSAYAVNPVPSNPVHDAIFLSYPLLLQPNQSIYDPVLYGKGPKDFLFVAFYTIVFSFTREFLMQRVIRPLAIKAGIHGRAKQSRFMEQGYTAIYMVFSGSFGLYVMRNSPIWYFNTTAFYQGFPHKSHDAIFKSYYLLEAAYWAQQAGVLVLQLEKPRKDFKELVAHHIITLSLIWTSYRFHFTYIGLAVYITHDISDFFLATSKVLHYLDFSYVAEFFGIFIVAWVYLRHYINLRILYSILTEFKTVGPYTLNWETQQYKCWISQIITFSLLASLQAVNLFWLFLILRIAKRMIFSDVLVDERSDDEDEAEQESEKRQPANGHIGSKTMANGVASKKDDTLNASRSNIDITKPVDSDVKKTN